MHQHHTPNEGDITSMHKFNAPQKLSGNRVLVTGLDERDEHRSTILFSSEWEQAKEHQAQHAAVDEYDAAVKDFFAPLTKAAAKLEAGAAPVVDPATYLVIEEGEEGTEGRTAEVRHLGHDSVVLRLLEQNDHSRLIWVGDTIEVLEYKAPVTGDVTGVLASEPTITLPSSVAAIVAAAAETANVEVKTEPVNEGDAPAF